MLPEKTVAVVAGREETDREDVLDVLRCRRSVIEGLLSRGFRAYPVDILKEDLFVKGGVTRKLRERSPDCVFNLFEGFGEASYLEIKFAEILESTGIPFTGNPSRALALCLDKDLARRTLEAAGLPVAPGKCVLPGYGRNIAEGLKYPLFVKPRMEDSSVGIDNRSLVASDDDLFRLLDEACSFSRRTDRRGVYRWQGVQHRVHGILPLRPYGRILHPLCCRRRGGVLPGLRIKVGYRER